MSQLPFLFLFIYYVCGRNKLPLKKKIESFLGKISLTLYSIFLDALQ